VRREYTNWEQIHVMADSEEKAQEIAEKEWDSHHPYTLDSFKITGVFKVEKVED
jgi:hypothetical protein